MKIVRNWTTVVARFLISLIFLAGGMNKILHWHEMESLLLNTLCEWQFNMGFSEPIQNCLATLIPLTPFLLCLAIFCEMVGGLSILLGVKEKIGAFLLILFLVPATILLHPFWFEAGAREVQLTHFLKNIAILGGLLMILLQGTEQLSGSYPDRFG